MDPLTGPGPMPRRLAGGLALIAANLYFGTDASLTSSMARQGAETLLGFAAR